MSDICRFDEGDGAFDGPNSKLCGKPATIQIHNEWWCQKHGELVNVAPHRISRVYSHGLSNDELNAICCVFGLAEHVCGCPAGVDHKEGCIVIDARAALERSVRLPLPRLHEPLKPAEHPNMLSTVEAQVIMYALDDEDKLSGISRALQRRDAYEIAVNVYRRLNLWLMQRDKDARMLLGNMKHR